MYQMFQTTQKGLEGTRKVWKRRNFAERMMKKEEEMDIAAREEEEEIAVTERRESSR